MPLQPGFVLPIITDTGKAALAMAVNSDNSPSITLPSNSVENLPVDVLPYHVALLQAHNELLETSHKLLKANNELLEAFNESLSERSLISHNGSAVSALEQSATDRSYTTPKRKRINISPPPANASEPTVGLTDLSIKADRPQLSTSSKRPRVSSRSATRVTGRTGYYCGICQSMRKQTPRPHMQKHLLDTCPSVRPNTNFFTKPGDIVSPEQLLLGCGYCARSDISAKFHGDAFLGVTRLAQHVVDTHCPEQPGNALEWDTNNAINNVLTSRVFFGEFERLRQLKYMHISSASLAWPPGDHANELLHNLECLGGRIMAVSEDKALSSQLSVSEGITCMLEAAYAPISDMSQAHEYRSGFHVLDLPDRHDPFDLDNVFNNMGSIISNGSQSS
jgi:hypothetical protein